MNIFEYTILILLSIQGTSLVLMSMNLFGIYIALELQNLCFYVLASLKRYSNFSTEAGLKYFLLGSFSSSLLLFGISLIYGFLGTVDLFDIFFILTNFNFEIIHILLILAIFFFLCGLLFKIGSVPFHWWIPDVYEGSPTVITMFFSILPKILLVFLFIKLYFMLLFFELKFSYLFIITGFLSIVVGGVYAMFQFKIKRFLAYSTIVNVGFILIGFSVFSLDGMYSIIVYLFCYLVPVLSFFLFLIFFRLKNKSELNNLFELSNFNYNTMLIFFISILFFSFLGLPPFMGFFGKFFIYLNLLNNLNYLIFLILLISSVIVGFYYIRVVRFLFFSYYQIEKKNILNINVNIFFTLIIYLNLFFLFFFDFFSEGIVNLILYSFVYII
jgi:NADH-quinone oxidoreductase subunit N